MWSTADDELSFFIVRCVTPINGRGGVNQLKFYAIYCGCPKTPCFANVFSTTAFTGRMVSLNSGINAKGQLGNFRTTLYERMLRDILASLSIDDVSKFDPDLQIRGNTSVSGILRYSKHENGTAQAGWIDILDSPIYRLVLCLKIATMTT